MQRGTGRRLQLALLALAGLAIGVSTQSTAIVDGMCPAGSSSCVWSYSFAGNQWMMMYDKQHTRDGARSKCQALGTGWDLASIHSAEEHLEASAHSISYVNG